MYHDKLNLDRFSEKKMKCEKFKYGWMGGDTDKPTDKQTHRRRTAGDQKGGLLKEY